MTARACAFALCLVAGACAARPTPPPAIETRDVDLDRTPEPRRSAAEPVAPPDGASGPRPVPLAEASTEAAPLVKLLESGAEPRRELRHTFRKVKQSLTIRARTRVKGANLPLPPMSLSAPMEWRIVEVNGSGDARFELTAGPFSGGASGAGALGALMGSGGGAPGKVAGWGWVTRRGVMKEFHVEEGAADGDAPVETGDPFPDEAVGVGARWVVTSTVREKDGPVRQVSEYQLLSIDKRSARTKLSRNQTPIGQPDGAATATSSGELTFRFGEVYPTGRLEMTRNMTVNLPGLEGAALQLASEVTVAKK